MEDLPYLMDIKLNIDCEDNVSLNETLHVMNNTIDSMYARWSLLPSFPERERCGKYMKTGVCLTGAKCKYDHPIRENITEEILADNMLYLTYTTERLIRILKTFSYEAAVDVLGTMCGVVVILEKEYDMAVAYHSYGQSCYLYGDLVMRLSMEIENFCSTKLSQPRKTPKHQQKNPRKVDENIPVFVDCSVRLKAVNQQWLEMEDVIRTDTVNLLSLQCTSLDEDYGPAVCVEEVTQLLSENIMANTRNAALSQKDMQPTHTSIRLDLLSAFLQAWPSVPDLKVAVFGSTLTMLGDGGSDIDLTLMLPSFTNSNGDLEKAATAAESAGFAVITVVKDTRIPVLKLRHIASNTEVDVVINNTLALQNSTLLRNYVLIDYRVRPLVLAVKYWARRRGCRDPRNATLSSYAWTLMVIYFLQMRQVNPLSTIHELPGKVLAQKQRESDVQLERGVVESQAEVESNIGKLLVEFFAFYGTCSPCGYQPFHTVLSLRNTFRVYKTTSPLYVPRYDLKTASETINMACLDDCRSVSPQLRDVSTSSGENMAQRHAEGQPISLLSQTTAAENVHTVAKSSPPTWRFCIEDPFEENDLGRVIFCMTGQIHIMNELKRAVTLFNDIIVKYRLMRGSADSAEERDLLDDELCDYWKQLCTENTNVPIAKKSCTICGQSGHFSKNCEMMKCNLCNQKGHFMRDCIMLFCSNCSQQGHFAKDCKKEKICRYCKQAGHLLKFCPLRSCAKCGSHKHKAIRCPVPAEAKTAASASLLDTYEQKSALVKEVEGQTLSLPVDRSAPVAVSDGGSRGDGSSGVSRSMTEGNVSTHSPQRKKETSYSRDHSHQHHHSTRAGLVNDEKKLPGVTTKAVPIMQFRQHSRERSGSLSSTGSTAMTGEQLRSSRRRQKNSARGQAAGGGGGARELGGGRLSARLAGAIESKVAVPMALSSCRNELTPGHTDLKLVSASPSVSMVEEKLTVVTPEVDSVGQAVSKSPRKALTGAKYATAKSGRVESPINAHPLLSSAKVDSKLILTPSSDTVGIGTYRRFSEKKGPATEIAEAMEDDRNGAIASGNKYISSNRDNTDMYLSDDKMSNSPVSVQSPAKVTRKSTRRKKTKLPASGGGRGSGGNRMSPQEVKGPESTGTEYAAGVKKNESKHIRDKKRAVVTRSIPSNAIPLTGRREEVVDGGEPVGGFFL